MKGKGDMEGRQVYLHVAEVVMRDMDSEWTCSRSKRENSVPTEQSWSAVWAGAQSRALSLGR